MKPEVSIILINYNTFKLTSECISSIYKNTHDLSFEIILIDNASKECPATNFSSSFPDIILISNKDNVGFGNANNQGMKIAKGEYLLLLNSDTLVHPNCINQSVSFLKKNLDMYQILGCEQVNGNNEIISSTFLKSINILQAQFYLNPFIKHFFNFTKKQPTKTEGVVGVSGSFMLMHSPVYKETRGFDPDFFMYSEETDWFKTRIKNKYQTVFYPEARITHFIKGSTSSKSVSQQEIVSQALFWYKRGYLTYLTYLLTTPFNVLLAALLIPFRKKENRSKEWNLIKIFYKSFGYFLFTIPRYSNKFGSRKTPLKVN
jgi:GT2 family glycosyltransferase